MVRRPRRLGLPLASSLLVFLVLACGPPAKPSFETEEAQEDPRERLAAKRKALDKGDATPTKASLKERLGQRRAGVKKAPRAKPRPARPQETESEEPHAPEPAAAVAREEPPPSKPAFPSHLSRREKLTLACFRDDFNVTEEAHMDFLLPREREFCRCMVDAIYSARVPASLQELLIEDFMKNRGQVEDAVPQFKQRWRSRCPM